MNQWQNSYRNAVRQNAGAAAFGAALLLFFGFYYLAEPSRGDLFGKSAWVLYHTLRIGGVATAAIALWLWTGHRPALVADALIAGLIGVLFILTGTGMLIDGGDMLQVIINAFCGVLFIRAATHSADLYRKTGPLQRAETFVSPVAPVEHPSTSAINPTLNGNAASQDPDSVAPPEGYLAALAKRREQQRQ
jgi:hypothetical protein